MEQTKLLGVKPTEEKVDIDSRVFGRSPDGGNDGGGEKEVLGAFPENLCRAREHFSELGYRAVVEKWVLCSDTDELLKQPRMIPSKDTKDLQLKLRFSSRFSHYPDDLQVVVRRVQWYEARQEKDLKADRRQERYPYNSYSYRPRDKEVFVLKFPIYTGNLAVRACELAKRFGCIEIPNLLDGPKVEFPLKIDTMPWINGTFLVRREYGYLLKAASDLRVERLAKRRRNREPSRQEIKDRLRREVGDLHIDVREKLWGIAREISGRLLGCSTLQPRYAGKSADEILLEFLGRLEKHLRNYRKFAKAVLLGTLTVVEDTDYRGFTKEKAHGSALQELLDAPLTKALASWAEYPEIASSMFREFPALLLELSRLSGIRIPKKRIPVVYIPPEEGKEEKAV